MARNADGTVVVKTTGKVASTPKVGTGTGIVKTSAAKGSAAGPKVVPVKGRGPVGRSALAH